MSYIQTIDAVIYGVESLEECTRYFTDWGLTLISDQDGVVTFETMEKSQIILKHKDDPTLPPAIEDGSTVREVVWGTNSEQDLEALISSTKDQIDYSKHDDGYYRCVDPNGLTLGFKKSHVVLVDVNGTQTNSYGSANRVDKPAPVYERAQPMRLAHVVFFIDDLEACRSFYMEELGFNITDSYTDRGFFCRCVKEGTHHNLFMLKVSNKPKGLNHVSFGVRDIYEVTGGGINMERNGWKTEIGPGRHPVSSAFFWYVKSPAGALTEYYADEDYLTENWQAREMTPSPEKFAEWAVADGINAKTRRQNQGD